MTPQLGPQPPEVWVQIDRARFCTNLMFGERCVGMCSWMLPDDAQRYFWIVKMGVDSPVLLRRLLPRPTPPGRRGARRGTRPRAED